MNNLNHSRRGVRELSGGELRNLSQWMEINTNLMNCQIFLFTSNFENPFPFDHLPRKRLCMGRARRGKQVNAVTVSAAVLSKEIVGHVPVTKDRVDIGILLQQPVKVIGLDIADVRIERSLPDARAHNIPQRDTIA